MNIVIKYDILMLMNIIEFASKRNKADFNLDRQIIKRT